MLWALIQPYIVLDSLSTHITLSGLVLFDGYGKVNLGVKDQTNPLILFIYWNLHILCSSYGDWSFQLPAMPLALPTHTSICVHILSLFSSISFHFTSKNIIFPLLCHYSCLFFAGFNQFHFHTLSFQLVIYEEELIFLRHHYSDSASSKSLFP